MGPLPAHIRAGGCGFLFALASEVRPPRSWLQDSEDTAHVTMAVSYRRVATSAGTGQALVLNGIHGLLRVVSVFAVKEMGEGEV